MSMRLFVLCCINSNEWAPVYLSYAVCVCVCVRACVDCIAVGCVLPADTASTTLSVLAQLVNFTSFYHKLHSVVIVVILNDVDRRGSEHVVETIATQYLHELSIGFIHVLQQASKSVPHSTWSHHHRQYSAENWNFIYFNNCTWTLLAMCHPNDRTVAFGIVGICNPLRWEPVNVYVLFLVWI